MLYPTIAKGVTHLLTWQPINTHVINKIENYMYHELVTKDERFPKEMQRKKYLFLRSMLHTLLRRVDEGAVSKDVVSSIIQSLVAGAFQSMGGASTARETFREQNGMYPPHFLVVSPTQACNLNCTGCYAASEKGKCASLSYDVFERIIHEAYSTFGCRFMTISGGEPFLYKDEGKTLMDIFQRYDDVYFLVFTNGTLIDGRTARQLAALGNVTPAISVEGYKEETDERRGHGTYEKIMKAMYNLRRHGVPFGISVTATSKNVDMLLSDEFYQHYFDTLKASYLWQFQLMPIGKAHEDEDLVVTPDQRLNLYRTWERLIEKGYPVADFWNNAILSNGCLAYGRGGGYLYINWHGQVMPCVFVPYYVDNVNNIYERDGSLSEALFSSFFKNGRQWQADYGLNDPKSCPNWLAPCSIRDHYPTFREKILTKNAKPENEQAKKALESEGYFHMMQRYDEKIDSLTKPIWENEYLGARADEETTEREE